MRFYSVIVAFMGIALLMGCNPSGEKNAKKPRIVASKGLPSELLLVVDKAIWSSDVADSLKSLVEGPVPGLPQVESYFRLTQIQSQYYTRIYTTMHSQLFVHLDKNLKQPIIGVSYDVIARPQIQVTVKAQNLNEMRRFLSTHGQQIRQLIADAQIDMRIAQLKKKPNAKVSKELKEVLGLKICAPGQIRATKRGRDFLWAGTNLNEKDQNLVVYAYPWDGRNILGAEYMAWKRDSVMQQNIPGGEPGQWMQTTRENGIPVLTSEVRNIGGKVMQEVHGLWEMRNGGIGGPFVSLTRIDTVNKRVLVAEGFVYSPGTDKRELVRELEAAIRTLH